MPPSPTATSPTSPADKCKRSVPVSAISRMMFFLWFSSRVLTVINFLFASIFCSVQRFFSCLVSLLVCPLTWYGTTPSEGATCRTDPCKYFPFDKPSCTQGVSPGLRGWQITVLLSRLTVVLRLGTLSRDSLFLLRTCPDSSPGRTRYHHSV